LSRGDILGLLADIKANPDDDSLRLILADLLDDSEDEAFRARAGLIRAQVREEPHPSITLLRAAHEAAWLGPLLPWVEAWGMERGLLRVQASVPSLRSKPMAALAGSEAWAWVDHVRLGRERASMEWLPQSPLLQGLNAFSAGATRGQGPELVAALAASPWLSTIRRLDLSQQDLGWRDLSLVFQSPHFLSVTDLDLSGNHLGMAGARALAEAPWAGRLRVLRLRRSHVQDHLVAALLEAWSFRSLRVLDLRDNQLGPAGARALASAKGLGRLEELWLFGNDLGAEGAEEVRRRYGYRAHLA
jgi:uncharacterized protein (TIGR02996 family)